MGGGGLKMGYLSEDSVQFRYFLHQSIRPASDK